VSFKCSKCGKESLSNLAIQIHVQAEHGHPSDHCQYVLKTEEVRS